MNFQNIFNRDFYPTPSEVIERMTMGEDLTDRVILEPSAGSGNIVKWCQRAGARYVMACEINDTLREGLYNYCNVIGQDWMNVSKEQTTAADYIIMNPPFSQAERHILHAWEVAPAGCTIIALMNHYSIEHPYGDNAKALAEKVELFGSRENLGDVFNTATADRRTAVEVELIKLYKPGEKDGNEFEGYIFDQTPEELAEAGASEAGLIPYNEIRELVARYIDAVKRFDEVQELSAKINESIAPFSGCSIRFGAHGKDKEGHEFSNITRDRFRKELQRAAWLWVFGKMKMQRFYTSVMAEKMQRFIEQESAVPFTMRNIYKVVAMLAQNVDNIMRECIVKAFDTICELSAQNSTAGEKWKTNANYMINRRFIVDGMQTEVYHYSGKKVPTLDFTYLSSRNVEKVEDLYKALCFVAGKKIEETNYRPFRELVRNNVTAFGDWFDFDWFRIRFYKKGTMHFEFLDEKVWQRFNQIAAEAKGWKLGKK